MPMFLAEMDRIAGWIKSNGDGTADAFRCWLHTQAPTDADIDRGRTTKGGGAYAAGKAIPAANVVKGAGANRGDLAVNAAVDFGTASVDVGTVTHWSLTRGGDAVAHGALPATVVRGGDTLTINANTIKLNASTT